MKHNLIRQCTVFAMTLNMVLANAACQAQTATHKSEPGPAVVTFCPKAFVELKAKIKVQPAAYEQALTLLRKDADKALQTKVRAITEKTVAGPSSDPHDYVSLSPYRWPNPDTPDGLPWIRKDGKVNPMRDQYDLPALESMAMTTSTLATGYYFLNDDACAKRAAALIEMWFINPATRMNPSVKHGQFIPGQSTGQCFGLLETTRLTFVLNAIGLIGDSPYWTSQHDQATKAWFAQYLHWLQTSDLGKEELTRPNNHSNWMIVQMMAFAIYVGDHDSAKQLCDKAKQNIDQQINADGSQPEELSRTRSLDYSEFSLRALLTAAWLSKRLGDDTLAHYTNTQGAGIKQAVDFIAPYLANPTGWPHKQIAKPKSYHFNNTLSLAQSLYPQTDYATLIKQLPPEGNAAQIFYEPPHAYNCSQK